MRRDRGSYLVIYSELQGDIDLLAELYGKNRLVTSKIEQTAADEFDWAALGYTIHNIYGLMENYFLRVAKFFENNIDRENWHRDLIDRMALEIPEIRPALLNREDLTAIHELRSFRHVFRNIYQGKLNEERLDEVNRKVPSAVSRFTLAHENFVTKLKKIASEL